MFKIAYKHISPCINVSNLFAYVIIIRHISINNVSKIKFYFKSFYQQLLEYWFELYSVEPENVKDIFEEPLWLNTNIVVGGYPIFYRKWWENNIKYIRDICSVHGTIMRKAELESNFSFVVNQMEYNSVVSAVPNRWRKTIKN